MLPLVGGPIGGKGLEDIDAPEGLVMAEPRLLPFVELWFEPTEDGLLCVPGLAPLTEYFCTTRGLERDSFREVGVEFEELSVLVKVKV